MSIFFTPASEVTYAGSGESIFVCDRVGADAERLTKEYFQGIYPADWHGSYDVDRYPSYSDHWRKSGRPFAARLESLCVYELAANQETLARSKRELNREEK